MFGMGRGLRCARIPKRQLRKTGRGTQDTKRTCIEAREIAGAIVFYVTDRMYRIEHRRARTY